MLVWFILMGIWRTRVRKLLEIYGDPQLRNLERRLLASFVRYRGRLGALTLTDERIIYHAFNGTQRFEIPLEYVKTVAVFSAFHIRGIEISAERARMQFVMLADPYHWMDTIGVVAHRVQVQSMN